VNTVRRCRVHQADTALKIDMSSHPVQSRIGACQPLNHATNGLGSQRAQTVLSFLQLVQDLHLLPRPSLRLRCLVRFQAGDVLHSHGALVFHLTLQMPQPVIHGLPLCQKDTGSAVAKPFVVSALQ